MRDIAEEVHLPLRSIHIDGLVRDAIGDIAFRGVLVLIEELPVLRGAISCYCYHFQAHALPALITADRLDVAKYETG